MCSPIDGNTKLAARNKKIPLHNIFSKRERSDSTQLQLFISAGNVSRSNIAIGGKF
jgi:hypothetical protein